MYEYYLSEISILLIHIDLQGVLNHYFTGKSNVLPIPADLLVTGSVPAGSGLSSSAALVVASTLAFLAVNGKVRIIHIRCHDVEIS